MTGLNDESDEIFDFGEDGENESENTGLEPVDLAGENLSTAYGEETASSAINRAKTTVSAESAAFTLERTQAGNYAEAALRELYDEDFDLQSPPDSLNRYERTLTLRRLEEAAIHNAKRRDDDVNNLPNVDHAVHVVSIMETYGELAEHNLARVAGATRAKTEVREAAADALSNIRSDTQEPERGSVAAVLDALAERLRPGDDA